MNNIPNYIYVELPLQQEEQSQGNLHMNVFYN